MGCAGSGRRSLLSSGALNPFQQDFSDSEEFITILNQAKASFDSLDQGHQRVAAAAGRSRQLGSARRAELWLHGLSTHIYGTAGFELSARKPGFAEHYRF